MRPQSSARNRKRAFTLVELLVAAGIMAIVSLIGFEILIRGAQYLRLNQSALDAQRSGLALVSQLHGGLQTASQALISATPEGVVFPSPYDDEGNTEFDPTTNKLLWRRWICYYYDAAARTVTRRETPFTAGLPPAALTFASRPVLNLVGTQISVFTVTPAGKAWNIDVTAGDMNDKSGYGVELHSQVTPRNS